MADSPKSGLLVSLSQNGVGEIASDFF